MAGLLHVLFETLMWALTALGFVLSNRSLKNVQGLQRVPKRSKAPTSSVAMLFPVRDGEKEVRHNLDTAAQAMAALPRATIIAIDDRSRDATPAILRDWAAASRGAHSVTTVSALPAGWFGRNHALWLGAQSAPPRTDYLLTCDHNIVIRDPEFIADCVAYAERNKLALLAVAPEPVAMMKGSPLIRLLVLHGRVSSALTHSFDPASDKVCTSAQFVLMARDAWDAFPHADYSLEPRHGDKLALYCRRAGRPMELCAAGPALTVQRTHTWHSFFATMSKSLVSAMSYSYVICAVLALSGVVRPVYALFFGSRALLYVVALGYVVNAVPMAVAARRMNVDSAWIAALLVALPLLTWVWAINSCAGFLYPMLVTRQLDFRGPYSLDAIIEQHDRSLAKHKLK